MYSMLHSSKFLWSSKLHNFEVSLLFGATLWYYNNLVNEVHVVLTNSPTAGGTTKLQSVGGPIRHFYSPAASWNVLRLLVYVYMLRNQYERIKKFSLQVTL